MKKIVLLLMLICLPLKAEAQTPVSLPPPFRMQFFSANGVPLAGGCVFFYQSGTSNPQATYTDSSGVFQNTNPVILDAGGFAAIWMAAEAYDVAVYSAGGSNCISGQQQYKVLNVNSNTALLNSPNIWTALQTFNGGISGTGSLGTLTAGPGILATVNTWTANQIFTSITANSVNPSLTGVIRLENTDFIGWRNAGATADLTLSPFPASGNIPADTLGINFTGVSMPFFASTLSSVNTAATGSVRMSALDSLCWRNTANTGDVCISKDPSDNLVFPGGSVTVECSVTTPVTVANIDTFQNLQTCTIPANEIGVGQQFQITATGRILTVGGGGQTIVLNILFDATNIGVFSFVTPAVGGTGAPWTLSGIFTGLSTGVSGSFTQGSGLWNGNDVLQTTQSVAPGTNTIDTTVTHTITINVEWGAADPANSITEITLFIQRIG